ASRAKGGDWPVNGAPQTFVPEKPSEARYESVTVTAKSDAAGSDGPLNWHAATSTGPVAPVTFENPRPSVSSASLSETAKTLPERRLVQLAAEPAPLMPPPVAE